MVRYFLLPRFINQLLYLFIHFDELLLLLLKHRLTLLLVDHVILELRLIIFGQHRGSRLGPTTFTRVLAYAVVVLPIEVLLAGDEGTQLVGSLLPALTFCLRLAKSEHLQTRITLPLLVRITILIGRSKDLRQTVLFIIFQSSLGSGRLNRDYVIPRIVGDLSLRLVLRVTPEAITAQLQLDALVL